MELYPLKVFLTVATELVKFFPCWREAVTHSACYLYCYSKIGERPQGEAHRPVGSELLLTDAGRVVLEFAKRFQNLESDLGAHCVS